MWTCRTTRRYKQVKVKYIYSFLWVFVVFILVGPMIGMLFITASVEQLSRGEFMGVIFFGYVFGVIPALFAGLINWTIMIMFYLAKNSHYFWPSALMSGAFTSIVVWLFLVRHGKFSWFFFAMCMTAAIICALLSSNRAWHQLQKK